MKQLFDIFSHLYIPLIFFQALIKCFNSSEIVLIPLSGPDIASLRRLRLNRDGKRTQNILDDHRDSVTNVQRFDRRNFFRVVQRDAEEDEEEFGREVGMRKRIRESHTIPLLKELSVKFNTETEPEVSRTIELKNNTYFQC